MTKFRARSHSVSGAFVFLLLGIFAVFALLMVVLCARFYRVTVNASDTHNDQRVAANYLMNTIHAADQRGAVSVRDGMLIVTWPAEQLYEGAMEEEGYEADSTYETRIYCHEGVLRELLTAGDSEFDPEDGEAICEMSAFTPSLEGQLLTIDYQDGRGSQRLHILLYCGEAAE